MHKSRATGPIDDNPCDPYRLVMIGDVTMIPVYAKERGVNADRIRKTAQRKREGIEIDRIEEFPDPLWQFPYYDLYLMSELDAYYFPNGVPVDQSEQVGTAESNRDRSGVDMSVYAARSGVRPVTTVRESGRALDYVRVEDSNRSGEAGQS